MHTTVLLRVKILLRSVRHHNNSVFLLSKSCDEKWIKSYKPFDTYRLIRIQFWFWQKNNIFLWRIHHQPAPETNSHLLFDIFVTQKWYDSWLSCCFSQTLPLEAPSNCLIFYSQAKYLDQTIFWLNFLPFASFKFNKKA